MTIRLLLFSVAVAALSLRSSSVISLVSAGAPASSSGGRTATTGNVRKREDEPVGIHFIEPRTSVIISASPPVAAVAFHIPSLTKVTRMGRRSFSHPAQQHRNVFSSHGHAEKEQHQFGWGRYRGRGVLFSHGGNTVLSLSASSINNNDGTSSCQPGNTYSVSLQRPMGLILEEVSLDDPTAGVVISSINDGGSAAEHVSAQLNAKTYTDVGPSIRDVIVGINDIPTIGWTLEDIMDGIGSTEVDLPVKLTLARPSNPPMTGDRNSETAKKEDAMNDGSSSIGRNKNNKTKKEKREKTISVVHFPNGSCISSFSGEVVGALANESNYCDITYSCRNGGCGSCEHEAIFVKKKKVEEKVYENDEIMKKTTARTTNVLVASEPRYIRPCVARVPRGYDTILILRPGEGVVTE